MKLTRIKEKSDYEWEGFNGETKVTEIELYEDESGLLWLNGAFTEKDHRGSGYCAQLLEKLITDGLEIYFSSASQWEHEQYNGDDDYDTRFLAGPEKEGDTQNGLHLVQRLIEREIVSKEFFKNPFENRYEH